VPGFGYIFSVAKRAGFIVIFGGFCVTTKQHFISNLTSYAELEAGLPSEVCTGFVLGCTAFKQGQYVKYKS